MVNVNPGLPAATEVWLRLVIVAADNLIVKVSGAAVPPSDVTVIKWVPTDDTKLAATATMILVVLKERILSGVFSHMTVASEVKFEPRTTIEKSELLVKTMFGLMLLTVGGGWIIVKVVGAEYPLTVSTLMSMVPGEVM
jgi:hypothetical protein